MGLVITVTEVVIPAFSTIGYGHGFAADGTPVRFVGDQRPMREVGEALVEGLEPEVELEPWQVLT